MHKGLRLILECPFLRRPFGPCEGEPSCSPSKNKPRKVLQFEDAMRCPTSKKDKQILSCTYSSNPTPGHISRENQLERYTHPHVHFSTVHNRQDKHARVCSVVSDSVTQRAPQAPSPWNFPGKNTGVSCHFLFQDMTWRQPECPLTEEWIYPFPTSFLCDSGNM